MFSAEQVAEQLRARADDFTASARASSATRSQYFEAYLALSDLTQSDMQIHLTGQKWPGALPTPEVFERGPTVSFVPRWTSAVHARTWALEILRGVPTIAIDGSQIAASKEFGVPMSLIQVAWFANHHRRDGRYVKDVRTELLPAGSGGDDTSDYAFAESDLSRRRFGLEMEVAVQQAERVNAFERPVVFIDGSFVLSFVRRMAPPTQQAYLQPLLRLLGASESLRVPVVGYVDLSYARDLVGLLRTVFALPDGDVFDSAMLSHLLGPFDRTAAWVSARHDVLPLYKTSDRDWSNQVCFVYLQIGDGRLPARVEFPRWVLDAGLLDHVLDVVRAEVIVGSGYPYALETADAAAVLTMEDRLRFFQVFHDFARSSGLQLLLPHKSVSKSHRR